LLVLRAVSTTVAVFPDRTRRAVTRLLAALSVVAICYAAPPMNYRKRTKRPAATATTATAVPATPAQDNILARQRERSARALRKRRRDKSGQ
jgi:hypothetical protein